MAIHKKRLGQHFLHDKNIINKIIKFVKPNKLDNFIEIGPGEGAITIPLIEKISKLILIEKDSSLIPILKDNLSRFENITFINEDILKYEFKDITIHIFIDITTGGGLSGPLTSSPPPTKRKGGLVVWLMRT